jgi:antitoxin MazE
MQTMIVKWGNSQGVRIPKTFLQNINISENEPIDLILENEKIIIKKTGSKKHKTIEERLIEFYGINYEKNCFPQQEVDWGKPAGKEIW